MFHGLFCFCPHTVYPQWRAKKVRFFFFYFALQIMTRFVYILRKRKRKGEINIRARVLSVHFKRPSANFRRKYNSCFERKFDAHYDHFVNRAFDYRYPKGEKGLEIFFTIAIEREKYRQIFSHTVATFEGPFAHFLWLLFHFISG